MRRPSALCDWCGTPLAGEPADAAPEADPYLCGECHAAYVADTAMREIRHNEDLPE